MTTLTVNIGNKKSEKAVKAVLDALGLQYSVDQNLNKPVRPLTKDEQRVFNNMKSSLAEVKLHQQGKINLPDARELLDEL